MSEQPGITPNQSAAVVREKPHPGTEPEPDTSRQAQLQRGLAAARSRNRELDELADRAQRMREQAAANSSRRASDDDQPTQSVAVPNPPQHGPRPRP